MQAYEHIYDPLESTRTLQAIVDIMAQRPRVNTDASLYVDSYEIETKIIKEKTQFFQEFLTLQKEIETEANEDFQRFQELKFRKVTEAVIEEWKMKEQEKKMKRPGSNEDEYDEVNDDQDMTVKEKMRIKVLKE